MVTNVQIFPLRVDDHAWVEDRLIQYWGSTIVVSRGTVHQANLLPGFIAWHDKKKAGLITYHTEGAQCEVVTLNSFLQGVGIGKLLIESVKIGALKLGCKRMWLITTNDNSPALTFYQKIGFQIAAIHKDALNTSRKLKPEIPNHGYKGNPIRNEIELEIWLS